MEDYHNRELNYTIYIFKLKNFLNSLKKILLYDLIIREETSIGALDSRKYFCIGSSAGLTPSVNSEETQSGTEEKTDDRDRDR